MDRTIHKLTIAGENWTRNLISSTITYSSDAGGSGMELEMYGSWEDYRDAPIQFWLGKEGKPLDSLFKGKIRLPKDNLNINTSSISAFGPFRLMSDQVLGTTETFVGKTLEYVIMELARRAGHPAGSIEVINGRQYKVEPGEQFAFDTTMNDVINLLMEKAEFVGIDLPGGRRQFRPKPKPGSNIGYRGRLTPNDYIEFTLDNKDESTYRKVIVYRNGENGKPVVWAERDVNFPTRFAPPRQRWYTVADFAGNQQEAANEAVSLAAMLRKGEKNFSISKLYDGPVVLYDGFEIERVRENVSRTYSATVTSDITISYAVGSPGLISFNGEAFEKRGDMRVIKQTEKTIAVSPGVLTRHAPLDITPDDDLIITDDSTTSGY